MVHHSHKTECDTHNRWGWEVLHFINHNTLKHHLAVWTGSLNETCYLLKYMLSKILNVLHGLVFIPEDLIDPRVI